MNFLSKTPKETAKIASDFIKNMKSSGKGATIVGLYGELGSGKTTFMKFLAESLGIEETIQSPTFVIEKIYKMTNKPFQKLIHIDAYRLDSGEDLLKLGWNEIISDPSNLICIEWPEKISDIMPKDHTKIFFEHVSENERKIKIEK